MPQTIVEPAVTVKSLGSVNGLSTSDTQTLKEMFPSSPIYSELITDQERKDEFTALVLDGNVNDGGHTFGTVSRDYKDAPDYADVTTGGEGWPASAWVPNPVSPGDGVDPSKVGEPPAGFGEVPNSQWGTGVGSQLYPNASSQIQSEQGLDGMVAGVGPTSAE